MEAGKGKSSDYRLSPAPCLSDGQKGCLRRLHFMRPFAPCFASREDGQPVSPPDHQEPDFIDQSNHSLAAAAEGPFLTTLAKPLKKRDIERNGHTSSPIDRISASPLLFVTRPARSL